MLTVTVFSDEIATDGADPWMPAMGAVTAVRKVTRNPLSAEHSGCPAAVATGSEGLTDMPTAPAGQAQRPFKDPLLR